MAFNNIEKILDKYFDGETSQKEEIILKEYFAKSDIPAHLEPYQAMFAYFAQNKKEIAPQNLQVKPIKSTWFGSWVANAAVVLLLFAIGYSLYPKRISEAEKKEAQIAFLETQKALQLISQNLNKGNKAVDYLNEFEISKKKVFKKQ
ncbi:MAG TPA: hypothetical protein ENK67_04155 [Flavobacteriia bacterium]|nr:hypothetical protein [Flavobacteriia bacterium]